MANNMDDVLLRLLADWRTARRAANKAGKAADVSAPSPTLLKARDDANRKLAKVERALCQTRAPGFLGLTVQSLVMCDLVETGEIDAKMIRLARNMRQTALANIRGGNHG